MNPRLEMDIRMRLRLTLTILSIILSPLSLAEESVNPTDTADIVDATNSGTPSTVITESPATDATTTGEGTNQPAESGESAENKIIRYVDDNLMIMMRAGNSNKHKIIRHIASGTELEVLETIDDYSRVRTRKGTEGWVLNQYLTTEPIARDKLKSAEQQLVRLETQNKQLQKELNDLTRQNDKLTRSNNKLSDELQNFRTVAAKPMKLQEENTLLLNEKTTLENNREAMQQEIRDLRDQSSKQWFLAGAGVLLFGVFMGMMIPRMRRRRKSDWSSL